jgi:hypothetical protein
MDVGIEFCHFSHENKGLIRKTGYYPWIQRNFKLLISGLFERTCSTEATLFIESFERNRLIDEHDGDVFTNGV